MLMILNEVFFISAALLTIFIIAGILLLIIVTLYNLTNPAAVRIKYYLKFPFKSLMSNPQVSEFINPIADKIRKLDISIVRKLGVVVGGYIKTFAVIIYKFETMYFHNFLRNIEELIPFLGLISRKIHDGSVKVYTAYILGFIVLFYFIFRTM